MQVEITTKLSHAFHASNICLFYMCVVLKAIHSLGVMLMSL
jgi:hypothetical protein